MLNQPFKRVNESLTTRFLFTRTLDKDKLRCLFYSYLINVINIILNEMTRRPADYLL